MWTERRPNEGETIKVEFAEFTKLGTMIGVFIKYMNGRMIIDFGDRHMWLDSYTSVDVFEPPADWIYSRR